MNPPPLPTDRELELLQVLWERGASSVRELNEALRDLTGHSFTTTQTILGTMFDKGLVARRKVGRSFLYEALASRDATERGLVRRLMDRAFGGSATRLVQRALDVSNVSDEELRQVERLLGEASGDEP